MKAGVLYPTLEDERNFYFSEYPPPLTTPVIISESIQTKDIELNIHPSVLSICIPYIIHYI